MADSHSGNDPTDLQVMYAEITAYQNNPDVPRHKIDRCLSIISDIWFPKLVVQARLHGVRDCDAEDVAQIAISEVIKAIQQRSLSGEEVPGALRSRVRHRSIDYFRQQSREREVLAKFANERSLEPTQEVLDAYILSAQDPAGMFGTVADLVRTLEKRDILILIMKFRAGMTSKEIAARLGMEEAAVRQRISRSIARLTKMWEQGEGEWS